MITPDSITTQTATAPIESVLPDTVAGTFVDSLPAVEMVEEVVAMQENTLEGLFGPGARLVEQTLPEIVEQGSITGGWFVGLFLVATFVYYLFVLFAYGSHIGLMVKVMLGNNLGIRVADELSYLFMRAVRNAVAMGIAAWSLVIIKWIEIGSGGGVEAGRWLLLTVIGVALLVGLVQRFATNAILTLVRRYEVREGVNILADTTMALAAIVVTPLALLLTVNTGATTLTLSWACIAVGSLALFIFCTKSLIFFIRQKISILLWFLYLCTVVLIPIGVVATLALRGGAI